MFGKTTTANGNLKLIADYSQKPGESENENPEQELINELLEAVVTAKRYHWATTNGFEHQYLGMFYDTVSELIDKFMESYQGCYRKKIKGENELEIPEYTMDAPVAFLEDFKFYLNSGARVLVMGNSALNNILDEIVGATDRALDLIVLK